MVEERAESGSQPESEVRRLISALERISETRRSASFVDETLPPATANQLRILAELDLQDPVMVTELAEVLSVTPATMSLNLKRLGEAGLVHRARDPSDRRVMNVLLTPMGHQLREAARGDGIERIATVLGRLRPDERRTVLDGVLLLADSLEAVVRQRDDYLKSWTER